MLGEDKAGAIRETFHALSPVFEQEAISVVFGRTWNSNPAELDSVQYPLEGCSVQSLLEGDKYLEDLSTVAIWWLRQLDNFNSFLRFHVF